MALKKLGRSVITFNGLRLETYPGASFDPGGIVRTKKEGHAVHGYSEQERAGKIEVEFDHGSETDLIALNKNGGDGTIMVETDTGQTYVGRNWWLAEPATWTDGPDSKIKATFEGKPLELMSVAQA